MQTKAECVTCGATLSGSRGRAIQWLGYQRTLCELQATAVRRANAFALRRAA